MVMIVITAIVLFAAFFLLAVGLAVISVVAANVVGRITPRAREASSRFIAGWSTKRGLRNRFFLAPLGMTFAMFAVLAVVELTATHRVRDNITESTRLVVRSVGPGREQVLYETDDREAIERFAEHISLDFSMVSGHCECTGEMTFDMYQGQELHYGFSLHHGERIRDGSVPWDRELSSSSRQKLAEWLDQTGVTKALDKAWKQQEQRRAVELEGIAQPADGD